MSSRVVLKGFDELVTMLTTAPEHIREDGFQIVREETEGAAQEMRNAYQSHSRTGRLVRRVVTEFPSARILVGIVRSKAPHAHLFEFGTKPRRNAAGANRGVMPAASPEVVVPIARRRRERMVRRLAEMLVRMGFQVPNV